MLRSGVSGCGGCARLRQLTDHSQSAFRPQLQQQRRRLRTLLGSPSNSQQPSPPPSLTSAPAASHEPAAALLGPLLAQRRGMAAARRVLEKATASASSSASGAAAGADKGAAGGRDSTPTRRRISRSIQAQAAASSRAAAPPPPSSSAAARAGEGGEGLEEGRLRQLELEQLIKSLEQGYAGYEELADAWEGEMEEEFLKAAAEAAASSSSQSGPGPLSQAQHAQHQRMMFEASAAAQQQQQQPSFVIPNARLEDGGGVETTRERLLRLEAEFEQGTVREALEEYKAVQETLFRTGKAANLPVVKRQIFAWYAPMIDAMESLHHRLREGKWADLGNGVGTYGPFLALVPPEKLAVLTIHEVVNAVVKFGNGGVPLASLLMNLAEAVRTEVNYLRLKDQYGERVLSSLRENGQLSLKRVNRKAKEALHDGVWAPDLKIKVGGMLLNELHRVATISAEAGEEGEEGMGSMQGAAEAVTARPAFRLSLEGTGDKGGYKRRGMVFMDARFFGRMAADDDEELKQFLTPRYRPMVVEPRRWEGFDSGGYMHLRTYVVRSQNSRAQYEALKRARMPEVYDALDFLGRVKWRINGEVLDVIQEAYRLGLTIGDLPSKVDLVLPPPPSHPPTAAAGGGERAAGSREQWRERQQLSQRVKKRNAELFSLRCDAEIKLRIAEEFREHEFFFPYNLDFRGRAYPIPPNLNHLGSDLCRGMLAFAERKPLGPEGLDWLKVHLANLCGKDKFSFADRIAYVDSVLPKVRDSALNPLTGHGWWMKAEEPFQALAVCKEITAALDSGDPASFLSGVPVHMDGSCNGLQHYAALGRDEEGGRAVNLIGSPEPQDVYTGVCERVIKHVHAEATRRLGKGASEEERKLQKYARLVDGMINRKVVKQTVMTSVYGVTYVGARKQIQARLKERFQERKGGRMLSKEEEQDVYEASRYVATVTLSKLAELFSSARDIMEWLATCSSLVAKQGQPMSWVTPLGLPVVQPYRRESGMLVKTLIQSVVLVDCSDKLPVSSSRQRSAFPPNFVHSLDSTHMLMTANRLKEMHIPFTAVHDSYWCHAAHVPQMNATLRDCFIDLYRRPILEDLRASLIARYPDVAFPPVPARGQLRLEEVKDSPYFFD